MRTCVYAFYLTHHFRLFVSGGYTASGKDSTTASVEMLDLVNASAELRQCAPMNEKRGSFAMIAFNNQLFVFGGWTGTTRVASCEKLVMLYFSMKSEQMAPSIL